MTLSKEAGLRSGERFLGKLPNGIIEVEDTYTKDTVSLDGVNIMRAKQAEIMALDTKEMRQAFLALSRRLRQFSENQASYWDLEELYTLGMADLPGKEIDDNPEETNLWYRCFKNARAVRERAAVTEGLLKDAVSVRARIHPDSPVEILSIASGSARCVLSTMEAAEQQGISVRARMLDIKKEALIYSMKLAREMGLIGHSEVTDSIIEIDNKDDHNQIEDTGQKIEFIRGDVVNINGLMAARPVDVAEAVGINDYLPDSLVTHRFLPKVHKLLTSGGLLIISNITHNNEESFLHEAVGWRTMFYRDSAQFTSLLLDQRVGFLPPNLTVHRNPNSIYRVIEARKALAL